MVPNNDDDDEGSDTSSVDSIPSGGVANDQYLNQFRWVQTNPHPAMRQMIGSTTGYYLVIASIVRPTVL